MNCELRKLLSLFLVFLLLPCFSFAEEWEEEWEEAVNAAYGRGFICQEYCTQYATTNIDLSAESGTEEADFRPFINMSGLYCYDGKFTGVFSRQSPGGIIASHHNEKNLPTYVVTGQR